MLKLRKEKLAKSQRKSYTVPNLLFLLLSRTGKVRQTGSTWQGTGSAGEADVFTSSADRAAPHPVPT